MRAGAGDGLVADVAVRRTHWVSPSTQVGFDPVDVALVVEVVSPTSRQRDRFLKPAVYAEAGIPAFWRIELDPAPVLFACALPGEAYGLVEEVAGRGRLHLPLDPPVPVEVDVRALVGG